MTPNQMVKKGMLLKDGLDYRTDDGRTIRRAYVGRMGRTLRWIVDGKSYLYRSLFEAYFDLEY